MTAVEAVFRGRVGAHSLDAAFALPGGVTGLFGPSGCGKTSILRCIAGLTRLPGATLRVGSRIWQDDAHFLAPHERPVGYVFQDPRLFAHLSVCDNLRYGMRRAVVGTSETELDVMVELLGLRYLLGHEPAALSGGERQRVAIGRALLTKPELLLMDEPLSALDAAAKDEILRYLETLAVHLPIPVVYVSHDLADLSLPVARLPEAAVVLTVTVENHDSVYDLTSCLCRDVHLWVPGNLGPAGTRRRLWVRASDVSLIKALPPETSVLNILPARLVAADGDGAHQMLVLLAMGGSHVLSSITRKSWGVLGVRPDDEVFVQVKGMALAD